MSEKIIYGQAWIMGDRVVQEVTRFTESGCFDEIRVLVENIWEDLTSSDGTYKSNDKKNYFYWEYEQTPIDNDDTTVKAMLPCPQPKHDLFEEPLSLDNANGDYALYWTKKFMTARENAEKQTAVQRKEIYLHGTKYMSCSGNESGAVDTPQVIPDMYINNNDTGDITNLLNLF